MAELHQALGDADIGAVRSVIVSGEAGVGKSRLLREFAAQARRSGSTVAVGAALPLGELGPPYALIVDALRGLGRDLAPELLAQVSASDAGALLSAPTPGGDITPRSQAARFESVLDLLERLSEKDPLVLIMEDLHWADRSTRDLLAYIARLARGKILIVASYRTEEVDEGHPLAGVVGELERSGAASRLELAGLAADDVGEMLRGILGGSIDDAVVARVATRSDGNPFFAEQLFAAERASPGAEIPALVRQVVLERIRRLPDETQATLRVVAAIGHRAEYQDIAASLDHDDAQLIGALRQSVRSAVLRPLHDGEREAYAFRHPLVREAVYGEILPGERAQIHRRIAEAMAGRVATAEIDAAQAAELAYHWDAAHDREKALVATVRAGIAAAQIHAHAAAHQHFERSLALWDRVGAQTAAVLSPLAKVELIEHSADAGAAAGEQDSAVERLRQAAALRGETGDLEAVAQHYIRLGRLYWSAGDDAASTRAYDEALAVLGDQGPSRARARAMAAKASGLMVRARYRESLKLAEAALAMAREVGSAADEAYAANVAGVDLAYLDQPERGIEHLEQARRVAVEGRDPEDLRRSYVNLTSALHRAGRRQEAVTLAFEGAEAAREMGLDRTWGRVQLVNAAVGLYDLGRWDEADRVCAGALERGGASLETCYFDLVRAQIATDQGRIEAAATHLEEARRLAAGVADPVLTASVEATGADLAMWRGDIEATRAIVERGLELLQGSDERPLQARLMVTALAGEADAASAARARRDAKSLAAAHARTQRLLDAVAALAGKGKTFAEREIRAYLLVARGHAARVDDTPAADDWRAAVSAWLGLEQPYPAALAGWRAAEAILAARASRDEAATFLRDSHRASEQLGAFPLRREVELLGRRARIDLSAPIVSASRAETAVEELGLTAREEEVLGLVAQGMTNRQVAEALFIAEKTASVHVSNILGKLNVSSRVEAAGVAFRLGLLSGGPADEDGASDAPDSDTESAARTFMFTDIARSTSLVDVIGDSAWTDLLRWHDATLRNLFTTYGGEEIDHAGDGFFVAFTAAHAAVGCAVAIQRTFATHRRSQGFAPSVRIGIHRAHANRDSGAYRGRGVHEAARIAQLAEPDEILVSQDSLAGSRHSFGTLPPRTAELKGIQGSIQLVPINWR